MINKQSATAFAHWLSVAHPDIFVAIARRAMPKLAALGDISDVLSSIGSSLGDAASAVGTWVSNPANVSSLSSVASAYFKSQTPVLANAQSAVFGTQLQRAQYGQQPANITYVTNPATGQLMPTYNGQALTPQQLQSLQPTFLQKYGIWLAVGGAGIALVFILRS